MARDIPFNTSNTSNFRVQDILNPEESKNKELRTIGRMFGTLIGAEVLLVYYNSRVIELQTQGGLLRDQKPFETSAELIGALTRQSTSVIRLDEDGEPIAYERDPTPVWLEEVESLIIRMTNGRKIDNLLNVIMSTLYYYFNELYENDIGENINNLMESQLAHYRQLIAVHFRRLNYNPYDRSIFTNGSFPSAADVADESILDAAEEYYFPQNPHEYLCIGIQDGLRLILGSEIFTGLDRTTSLPPYTNLQIKQLEFTLHCLEMAYEDLNNLHNSSGNTNI